MSFIVLPSAGDVAIFGQKTSWDKLGIDVMAQLQALVLKAEGREDGPEMELTDGAAVSYTHLTLPTILRV